MKKISVTLIITAVFATSCGEAARVDSDHGKDTAIVMNDSADHSAESNTQKPPKGFYWNYDVPTGVEEAEDMTEEEARKIMNELPESDGNFFGLELWNGSIVQFMYDGQKKTWFLDIPNPVTQDSYNADVTRDEAVKIIGDVYSGKSADDVRLMLNR